MRTRPEGAEPEVWFRIVHLSRDCHPGAPGATYREQMVEIALGPKGAFENGNIGALTRRVSTERVVSAAPPRRGNPKPPKMARMPRVVELLRRAIEWQALLESDKIANQTEFARREGISRARVTQIMSMLRLAPEIQEHILAMSDVVRRPTVTERMLRPLRMVEDQHDQIREYQQFLA